MTIYDPRLQATLYDVSVEFGRLATENTRLRDEITALKSVRPAWTDRVCTPVIWDSDDHAEDEAVEDAWREEFREQLMHSRILGKWDDGDTYMTLYSGGRVLWTRAGCSQILIWRFP